MTINWLRGSPSNRRTTGATVLAVLVTVILVQFGVDARSGRSATAATVPPTSAPARIDWPTLDTPTARGQSLGRMVVAGLVTAGVPVPAVEVTDTGGALGQFVHTTWTLQLSAGALSAVVDQSSAEAQLLTETAYHEARHAEQWFRIAQLRSSQGRVPGQLAAELALPDTVVAAAAGRPLVAGSTEAIAAQKWLDSIYGPGAARRNAIVHNVLTKKSSYNAAAGAHAANPDLATATAVRDAKSDFDQAYALYLELPEEADAFAMAEVRAQLTS